jgi:hypothetical protein
MLLMAAHDGLQPLLPATLFEGRGLDFPHGRGTEGAHPRAARFFRRAAGGLLLGCVSFIKYRLATAGVLNLQPALSWPEPRVLLPDASNRCVILTTIEYDIAPADATEFLVAVHELGNVRQRNVSYGWGVFEDMESLSEQIQTGEASVEYQS